ncbi:hypothetical protein Syun_012813 [Stephania yunnanensis]|uniref:Uncharacterized protein n=1 Tax=Stephania yunnanensis TaxID=152371 RepID=A0AAP0K040_9MAGN
MDPTPLLVFRCKLGELSDPICLIALIEVSRFYDIAQSPYSRPNRNEHSRSMEYDEPPFQREARLCKMEGTGLIHITTQERSPMVLARGLREGVIEGQRNREEVPEIAKGSATIRNEGWPSEGGYSKGCDYGIE